MLQSERGSYIREKIQAAKSGGFKTTEQEYAKACAPVTQVKILI
jgi:hypothetical protein